MSMKLLIVESSVKDRCGSLFYSAYTFNILYNKKLNKWPDELWTVVIQLAKHLKVEVLHHDSDAYDLSER